jgi:hypothetical protein
MEEKTRGTQAPRMNEEVRRRIRANLFEAALPAIGSWDTFPWHTDTQGNIQTHKPHSSQALAIDVFGTVKTSQYRDLILGQLADHVGLDQTGPWDVSLEWCSPDNELHEKRQTQIDAAAASSSVLMFFECKFTELGGSCSQVEPLKKGPQKGIIQCNGKYQLQTNPVNGISSQCALTGKGILYWDVIPQIFPHSPRTEYAPCPFSGPYFQWMRILTLCFERARTTFKRPVVIAAYAGHQKFEMPQVLASSAWRAFAGSVGGKSITLSSMSYQTIIGIAEAAVADLPDEVAKWRRLRRWVEQKIFTVVSSKE